ncbi:MAG: hypothetical protein KAJ23_12950 [Maribacter sp.]|nr:hypothetical protein [Maribacter sp.]
MKIKLLMTLMLMPMITMAHAGHQHNATDILLNPLSWADHGLILGALAILLAIVVIKIVMKYLPKGYNKPVSKKQ